MNRIVFTTVYDEILHLIETMPRDNFDFKIVRSRILKVSTEFKDNKDGHLDITLINEDAINNADNKVNDMTISEKERIALLRELVQKHLWFTAQDIIIYRILLSHYINNQVNGVATITFDILHKKYRKKAFKYEKGKDKYDDDTLDAYITSIKKLINLKVIINFTNSNLKIAKIYNSNDKSQLVDTFVKAKVSKNINLTKIGSSEIHYSLGKLGDMFLTSKQCGQLLPEDIYSLRFNQIDTFNMAIYIGRMIIINRRWRKQLTIYISTMLSKMMKYDSKGYTTFSTYFEYLARLEPVKRNKKIKYIEKQLRYILDLLVEKEIITEYKFRGKFQYKYIKDGELSTVILIGKKTKDKV